jgi:uncharacterized ferritin-like protein (DUF455 family)
MSALARWALDYVTATSLALKLDPPEPPRVPEPEAPVVARPRAPGRPPELRVVSRAKGPRPPFSTREKRAHALHTFFHHELQAAELMASVLVAFPETPRAFRVGLLRVLFDEIRHMRAYQDGMAALGFVVGDFPVRDWFWERLGDTPSPAAFVATMGVGFEGGNLDHATRFAKAFDDAGDPASAAIVRRVGEEEIVHVRFALHWLARFLGKPRVDFDDFARAIPPPLTPSVMRGVSLDRDLRERAGLDAGFLAAYDAFVVENPSGRPAPRRPERG